MCLINTTAGSLLWQHNLVINGNECVWDIFYLNLLFLAENVSGMGVQKNPLKV